MGLYEILVVVLSLSASANDLCTVMRMLSKIYYCFQELLSDPECYPDLLMRAQELINLLKLPKYVLWIVTLNFIIFRAHV